MSFSRSLSLRRQGARFQIKIASRSNSILVSLHNLLRGLLFLTSIYCAAFCHPGRRPGSLTHTTNQFQPRKNPPICHGVLSRRSLDEDGSDSVVLRFAFCWAHRSPDTSGSRRAGALYVFLSPRPPSRGPDSIHDSLTTNLLGGVSRHNQPVSAFGGYSLPPKSEFTKTES